jgi:hypothetical protein
VAFAKGVQCGFNFKLTRYREPYSVDRRCPRIEAGATAGSRARAMAKFTVSIDAFGKPLKTCPECKGLGFKTGPPRTVEITVWDGDKHVLEETVSRSGDLCPVCAGHGWLLRKP